MKRKHLFLLPLLLTLGFSSCDQEQELADIKPSEGSTEIPTTKGMSIDEPSISNPTLHNDWETVVTIYLNGGKEIDAPWVYKESNSMNIPLNYRTDIKKEDGWKLLSHTMLKQSSDQPNYILFYNIRTGIFKGFYYSPTNIKNKSFVWVLESANGPTSVLPSNQLVQGIINTKSQYITTSNILDGSNFNFGQINQGWNAFSFELPYGTVNKTPLIRIKGYNPESSEISSNGDYSGEVIIPIPKEDPSGLKSIVSTIGSIAGIASNVVPQLKVVQTAISVAGAVLGQTSLYKSKTSVTNIRATSSGKINLTGSSFTEFGGVITSIDFIDLRRINGNKDLGLWNLSQNPQFTYDKYMNINEYKNEGATTYYRGCVNASKNNIESNIIISPEIKPLIKSFRITNTQFFYQTSVKNYETKRITDNCYFTGLSFNVANAHDYTPPVPPNKNPSYLYYVYYKSGAPFFNDLCVNITVEFEYYDGSIFISSRNYKANLIEKNNYNDIKELEQYPNVIVTVVG